MPLTIPASRFTTAGLSALPVTGKGYDLSDPAVQGLLLRVGPRGSKRWLFRFKWNKRLSTDHDPLFRFHRWRANLRILEIEELKSIPFVPRSHPFIEQLIGTLRREYLDQTFFWNGLDLHRKLDRFAAYYNQRRVHAGLGGRTPVERCGTTACQTANLQHFAWRSDCSGLFHTPIPA